MIKTESKGAGFVLTRKVLIFISSIKKVSEMIKASEKNSQEGGKAFLPHLHPSRWAAPLLLRPEPFESPNKTGHHRAISHVCADGPNPSYGQLKGNGHLSVKFPSGLNRWVLGWRPWSTLTLLFCLAAASAVVPIPGTFSWPLAARGKPRRGMLRRAVFSDVQRKALEKMFQKQKYISKPDRKKLAAKLGLKDSQVSPPCPFLEVQPKAFPVPHVTELSCF